MPQLGFEQEPGESGLSIWQLSSMPARLSVAYPAKTLGHIGLMLKPRHKGMVVIVQRSLREVIQLSPLANTFSS